MESPERPTEKKLKAEIFHKEPIKANSEKSEDAKPPDVTSGLRKVSGDGTSPRKRKVGRVAEIKETSCRELESPSSPKLSNIRQPIPTSPMDPSVFCLGKGETKA